MPTFGSLFAGIGGIDLGLERAGWECRWQVEWDEFCSADLRSHWPDIPRAGDITAVEFTRLERVDLIAGGFPCQPVSVAGKRRAQSDERWLWPEFARAIREVGPRYVLVENVRNLLAIDDGGPLGEVLGTLASLGYDTEWDCLPASAFGAPHQRDRLFLLAYANRESVRNEPVGERWSGGQALAGWAGEAMADADGGGCRAGQRDDDARQPDAAGGDALLENANGDGGQRRRSGPDPKAGGRPLGSPSGPDQVEVADDDRKRREVERDSWVRDVAQPPLGHHPDGCRGPVADAHDCDAQGQLGRSDDAAVGQEPGERPAGLRSGGRREFGSPQSRVVRAPNGLPPWMDGHRWPAPPGPQYDWEPPRTVRGRVPNRAARIKALGNAVVPQVVEVIGRRLLEVSER